jgi:hypothetical protein
MKSKSEQKTNKNPFPQNTTGHRHIQRRRGSHYENFKTILKHYNI